MVPYEEWRSLGSEKKSNGQQPIKKVEEPKSVRESFIPFSCPGLAVMFFLTVVSLLFAYLLFKIYVWVAIFGFSLGASIALCELLALIWRQIFGSRFDHVRLNLKSVLDRRLPDGLCGFCCSCCCCLCYIDAPVWGVVLYFVSLTVTVAWFVFRKNPYIFVLYDSLAAILCIYVIKVFRIGSLKWITYLLGELKMVNTCMTSPELMYSVSALTTYDLFMVFGTSFFHSKGCNIMEEAATGGACSDISAVPPDPYKEQLPAMFVFPDFNNPVLQCYNLTVDLQFPTAFLGFGDVIVPGLLVAYSRIFDTSWNHDSPYFLVGVVGYAMGMGATLSALSLMGRSQPALIYLVPFTLIPTHILAWCRGQWRSMWLGHLGRDKPTPSNSKDTVKD
uniref:Uncharacterized protein n=1 Tax=Romanomermis culicivorax TaxID=13658 RepID=A0A915HKP4_ROMCU